MKRWFQYEPVDGPFSNGVPRPVLLLCACGVKSPSIRAHAQHHADYHTPGLCSVRMLLDTTEVWLEKYHEARRGWYGNGAEFPITYSQLLQYNSSRSRLSKDIAS